MKYTKLAFGFFCLFTIPTYAMDKNIHTLDEYKNAFSVKSLKEFVIQFDNGLLRDFFPENSFSISDEPSDNHFDDLDSYLSENSPCVLRSTAYSKMYRRVKMNSLTLLENKLRATIFLLHELIVDTVLSPIIDLVYPFGELGAIADPHSQVRAMMNSYVKYLSTLIKRYGAENENLEAINFITMCPPWFDDALIKSYRLHSTLFNGLHIQLCAIKIIIRDKKSGQYVNDATDFVLGGYGYINSIATFLPYLINGDDDVSEAKRVEIGKALTAILNGKYNLTSVYEDDNFSDNIVSIGLANYILDSKHKFLKKHKSFSSSNKKKIYYDFNKNSLKNVIDTYNPARPAQQ